MIALLPPIAAGLVSRDVVRAAFRPDVLPVTIGVLLLAMAAFLASSKAGSRRDPALLWLSAFAGLYGVRLLADTNITPFLFPLPHAGWRFLTAAITYVIGIPALRFVAEVIPSWRRNLNWITGALCLFAVCGLASDAWHGRPLTLGLVNNILVLALLIAFLISVHRQPGLQSLRPGIWILSATVVFVNIAGLAEWNLGFNIEPFGIAVFFLFLGRMALQRVRDNEQRLLALDQELAVARRIQESILPRKLPTGSWFQVAARYVPMTEVAGDFYEFLQSESGGLGILVADVSGHGVPAALIASMLKVGIASQQAHADNPGAVLEGLNQVLAGKIKGQFVTAVYAYLEPSESGGTIRLRMAGAGHPPALLHRSGDSRVEALSGRGLALGLRTAARYTTSEANLSAGDRLMLYTDGLFEAFNPQREPFGDDRLRAQLESQQKAPVDQAADAIFAAVREWTRGPADDDLTLVLLALTTRS